MEVNTSVETSRYFHHCQIVVSSFLPALKLVCLIALATANSFPADPAGRLSGRVTDPQGATVFHAEIKVTDQNTSTLCQTTSDAQGYFFCPRSARAS